MPGHGVEELRSDPTAALTRTDMEIVKERTPSLVSTREGEGKARRGRAAERQQAILAGRWALKPGAPQGLSLSQDVPVQVLVAQDTPIRIAPAFGMKMREDLNVISGNRSDLKHAMSGG